MHKRFAWARLNAYGLLVVGLMLLSIGDLLQPEQSNVASVIGRVPELQPTWTVGYLIAAFLLLAGFLRSSTLWEVAGLGLLSVGLTVQTLVIFTAHPAFHLPDMRAVAIWVIVVGCAALRISALMSRQGLTITIPPRRQRGADE